MLFLAIESSCDETAAAVFDDGLTIRSSVVASQLREHQRFGGVVPEVAARAHLTQLLPVVQEALEQAGVGLKDIGAIAVMNSPGLIGALLVGVSAAKALAIALEAPLFAVNHIEAHLFACRMAAGRDIFPAVGLVVSGGHTSLFRCASALEFELLGGTIDDAAGEAFDKVAALLELGFPGGPAVERTAKSGNAKAFRLPRAFLHEPRLDFSFSGLKTAVRYLIRDLTADGAPLTEQQKADLAASFQQAVVDALVAKCRLGLERTGLGTLAVGGGVSANSALRAGLERMAKEEGATLVVPPLSLCTDNAAMAALAVELWRQGKSAPLDMDAEPRLAASLRRK
jgi:N6-L-threonylcarbamoyladenine synthase